MKEWTKAQKSDALNIDTELKCIRRLLCLLIDDVGDLSAATLCDDVEKERDKLEEIDHFLQDLRQKYRSRAGDA